MDEQSIESSGQPVSSGEPTSAGADSGRPEWLPEKFKTGEDMASSYKSLEQRLGSAPKSYDLSKADGWVSEDDEGFRELLDLAKEKSVPQDVMDKMLETTGRYASREELNFETEMQTLGEDAKERLDVLNNWAKSNFSEDSFNALTGSIKTAQGIKALEEIRGMMLSENTQIPTGKESSTNSETMEDIQSDMTNNLDKYKSDSKFRSEIQSRIDRVQNSGYVDKSSA